MFAMAIYGNKQRFSNLSEVGASGLLNLGKRHLGHQNWEILIES